MEESSLIQYSLTMLYFGGITYAFIYVIVATVEGEYNIKMWTAQGRGVLALIGGVASFIVMLIIISYLIKTNT